MRKLYLLLGLTSLIVLSLSISAPSTANEIATMNQEHLILSEQVVDELWNNANSASVSEFYQLPFVDHAFTINEPIPWVPKAWGDSVLRMYHQAFPDLEVSIVNVVATDDMAVVHYSARGTHESQFANVNGVPITASGKILTWDGVWMFRIAEGKIVEQWSYSNNPLVQQSGFGNMID